MLTYRNAVLEDVPLLADLNHQLIQDEGHSNPMTPAQLAERMEGWLTSREYWAVLFYRDAACVAYALLRDDIQDTYLRHFFVARPHRRQGIGREAISLLLREIVPPDKPVRLEVLVNNERGLHFWRSVGFKEYALTMLLTSPTHRA